MNQFFKNLFGFSPAESRGFIVLFVLIILAISAPFFIDFFKTEKVEDVKITMNNIKVEGNKYEKYDKYDSKYPKNNSKKSYQLKQFDPNLISAEEFKGLGIPGFIAERIVKYREKGGKFKRKEDLSKIYGLLPEKYEELEPYILLPFLEIQKSQTPQTELTAEYNSNKPANPNFEVKKEVPVVAEIPKNSFKKPVRFDINVADTTTLKQIPGIGSGYAKRIIKFRESLGGFISVNQISETFGLPPEVFTEIEKFAFYQNAPKKININTATIEEIDAHPYINKFQAKTIVAYRTEHGNFDSIDDLKKIKTLNEDIISKINPYLNFK
jgi:competence protein ComEA